MVSLEHRLSYAAPSGHHPERGLEFVCAQNQSAAPLFFQGHFRAPQRTAQQLLALTRVVGSRFHTPAAMLARILREADPVVTCAPDRLRWEGFSACCGAYCRVDLLPEAVNGALLACGTTNVDLGPQARAALAQLRPDSPCSVSVGPHHLELAEVTERKVELPLRWLKGLVEVQAIMAAMHLRWEISAVEARRFLQSLPKGPSREAAWVVPSGRGLRLSQVASPNAVRLAGWQRLGVLGDLLRHCLRLRIYQHSNGSSAWEMITADSHFHLVLSPEIWRGFSGEGQVLSSSSSPTPSLQLDWRPLLSLPELQSQSGLDPATLGQHLSTLAHQGKLGYDLALGGYFYRPLPYPLEKLGELHPRLQAARKLPVRWEDGMAWVGSGETTYRVAWQGSTALCNCPWYARHQLERGACKHILAAELDLEKEQP